METRFAFVDVLEVFAFVLMVVMFGVFVAEGVSLYRVVADRGASAHASSVDPIREGVRP